MSDLNLGLLTATQTQAAAASAVATASAVVGKQIYVMGFDGSSDDQPFTVVLAKGGATLLTMKGSADMSVGRDFGINGIACGDNTAVTVTTTPAAAGQCTANLIYKIIF